MKRLKRILTLLFSVIGLVMVVTGGVIYVAAQRSRIPDNINMSSSGMDDMAGMDMSGMSRAFAAETPNPEATPITALVEQRTDTPVKTFTLTAQPAVLDLGNGTKVDAYTFNGTVPGPELRVQQGDLVVVTLINKLPVNTTIHWHADRRPEC